MRSQYHFTYIKTVKLESQRLEEGALSILRYLDTFTTSCFMYYGLRKQTYQYYSRDSHHIEINIRSAGLELKTFRIPVFKECAENLLSPWSFRQTMLLILMTNGTKIYCCNHFDHPSQKIYFTASKIISFSLIQVWDTFRRIRPYP